MLKILFWLGFGFLLSLSTIATANDKVLRIYHDSDYSAHSESAESMRMGFLTALDEVNNEVNGYRFELVKKNHHGNVVRSKRTMQQYLKDPQALFILGGLHSPPYIKFRQYINENEILLMVPWAAGGPITRYADGTNWVFRLSVDDTKAGLRISEFAVRAKSCKLPHLLLEDTGWGKSNFASMTGYFKSNKSVTPTVTWYNWNTRPSEAKIILRDIANSGSDCLLFVGNAVEGAVFMNAISELDSFNLPVLSHWGITGGDFAEQLGPEVLSKLDLTFVQSCFSFVTSPKTGFSQAAFKRAQRLFPDVLGTPSPLQAPTGFIHAYDLGRLLINALQSIELTDDMASNRRRLRDKLEQLDKPIQGLVKTYQQPFKAYSPDHPDAHEALGLSDHCMATFTPGGVIQLVDQ
ncbi:hypothetical protein A9Q99_00605 [Gammaproteobacteria bacterium 45_16_T64]|nr:hypothetical protein A9Q99_00605 [Gammaproteobacteria bacterium 45_16_T64]